VRFRVLGSGSAVPTGRRGCPGHLLRGGGEVVLLDPGSGAVRAAAFAGTTPRDVTTVVLSHLHIDHHLDLATLLFALRDPRFEGRKPLRVVGPPGLQRIYSLWRAAYGKWVEAQGYALTIEEAAPGPRALGGLQAEAVVVPHGDATAYGWRFREKTGGPVLAYSGDTTEGPGAVDAGRGADLFVLECTLPETATAGKERHLTPSAAGRIASAARCRRLLLVHFSSAVEGTDVAGVVRKSYAGQVTLAEDGTEVEV